MLDSLLVRVAKSPTLEFVERRADGVLVTVDGAQLVDRCHEWSAYLRALELPRGTPLLLPMRATVDTIAILLATWCEGLMPIPVKGSAPVAYLELLAARLPSAVIVTDSASCRLLSSDGRRFDVSPNARFVAYIPQHTRPSAPRFPGGGDVGLLTTGSTGASKVVVHALERVLANATLHAQVIGLMPQDRIGLSLPLSFSYGLVAGLLATLLVEARGILVDPEQADVGGALLQHRVTVGMGTPYSARQLLVSRALESLRVLTIGGDVLHVPLARAMLEQNPELELFATYGLSEAGPRVATCRISQELLDHFQAIPLGRPLPGVRLRLAPSAEARGTGELLVSSPTRMLGYLDDPDATALALDRESAELRSGDQFTLREGELFFAGRNKRVICRAGEKLYPAGIERHIVSFGGVLDALVRALPDAQYGEVPEAYVVPGAGFSLQELERHLRRALPRSQVPAVWHVVERLPLGSRK